MILSEFLHNISRVRESEWTLVYRFARLLLILMKSAVWQHLIKIVYCLLKSLFEIFFLPYLYCLTNCLMWFFENNLSYWLQVWQHQSTNKRSSPGYCPFKAWHIYVIVFNKCRITERVCGRFYFLVKLQAVQTPPMMFFWEFFEKLPRLLFFWTHLDSRFWKTWNAKYQ